jgi:hypothetical protein
MKRAIRALGPVEDGVPIGARDEGVAVEFDAGGAIFRWPPPRDDARKIVHGFLMVADVDECAEGDESDAWDESGPREDDGAGELP